MSVEIYPVVHFKNMSTSLEQVDHVLDRGADGVYLIDHNSSSPAFLLEFYVRAREQHPDKFLGVNFLQLNSGFETFNYLSNLKFSDVPLPDGVWQDKIRPDAQQLLRLRTDPEWDAIKYGAGVAFKATADYTADPEEAAAQARELSPYVDVVVTSGLGTNVAANPNKIAAMKAAIGDQRLAIASGISVDNFEEFRPHIDEAFVSSSIETKVYSGVFDQSKLQGMIDIAHQL